MKREFAIQPAIKLRSVCAEYANAAILLLLDYLAIAAANAQAVWMRNLFFPAETYLPLPYEKFWLPLLFLLFLYRSGVYLKMQPALRTVQEIFYAVCCGMITCVFLLYFLKASLLASRFYIAALFFFILLNLYLLRYSVGKLLKKSGVFCEPVLLLGAGKTAERVMEYVQNDVGYRYKILGFLDDHPQSEKLTKTFRPLGKLEEAKRIVEQTGVQTVLITAPGLEKEKLQRLINQLQPIVRNIAFVPDLIGTPLASTEIDVLFSEEILLLKIKNNLARRHNQLLKRSFDLVFTICGGLLISPLLLFLAMIVGIENKGHIIFPSKRLGRNGNRFFCYKFQSMVPNAEEKLKVYLNQNPQAKKEWEETFKLTNDPRITKIGRFLRKTSLDELPQLWNVLKGEMSLVGPRPMLEEEKTKYGEDFREYAMVRPGITGMWQTSGRNDVDYRERVKMNTWYVRNWSLWLDLLYLYKTVKIVATGKGAY